MLVYIDICPFDRLMGDSNQRIQTGAYFSINFGHFSYLAQKKYLTSAVIKHKHVRLIIRWIIKPMEEENQLL